MKRIYTFLLLLLVTRLLSMDAKDGLECVSPQYIEFGETGTLTCTSKQEYFGLFWYYTTDYRNSEAFIYLRQNQKGGKGYDSGEYDLDPTGSLIIKNVSWNHELEFTVVLVDTPRQTVTSLSINAIVTVAPLCDFPVIDECGGKRICFKQMSETFILNCHVEKSKPIQSLTWMMITAAENITLVSTQNKLLENYLITTHAKTNVTLSTQHLVTVYSCKAASQPFLLREAVSFIAILNPQLNIPLSTPVKKYALYAHQLELFCTDRTILYLSWKRFNRTYNKTYQTIVNAVMAGDMYSEIYANEFHFDGYISLIVQKIDETYEGTYICVHGDGSIEDTTTYDVEVYDLPSPEMPVIAGCTFNQYCILLVNQSGTLTCTVFGIRPVVKLQLTPLDEALVSFSHPFTTVRERGHAFDVSITVHFQAHYINEKRLIAECKVSEYVKLPHQLKTTFDLYVYRETSNEDNAPTADTKGPSIQVKRGLTVAGALAIFFIPLLCLGIYWICRVRRRKRENSSSQEMERLLKGKIDILREQLKMTYKDIIECVCPIPYNRNKVHNIADVYVDSPIEIVSPTDTGKLQNLISYRDLLDGACKKYTRVVLEGPAGYGKTMLCFQLLHEWCNNNPADGPKKLDILIYLRMRHLGGIQSIYHAIKRFLLPRDSTLSVEQIKGILYSCDSLVIIFDGFNRFPDKDNYKHSELRKIMMKHMFQRSQVILTTRTSCLPDAYANNTTRMRLLGFDEDAQQKYIINAVCLGGVEESKRILRIIKANIVLNALCQVPLFFVLFAYITKDPEIAGTLHFSNVTSFLKTVMTCFHHHRKNTLSYKPANHDYLIPDDHSILDEISFKALQNGKNGLLWEKEKLRKELGESSYQYFNEVGILVEETVCGNASEGIFKGNTVFINKVKFYHNILCEWYAAHSLSRMSEKLSSKKLQVVLRKINPLDHQYIFRFTCGINKRAVDIIISYLKQYGHCDKYQQLCILEQPENTHKVKLMVTELCKSPVNITPSDSKLVQRSTIQLLEMASSSRMPIECVWLTDMACNVNAEQSCLTLKSGLNIPPLGTLQQLSISDFGREIQEENFVNILNFTFKCPALTSLRFRGCHLPYFIPTERISAPERAAKIAVQWRLALPYHPWYVLDLSSGRWKNGDEEMSEGEYNRAKKTFETQDSHFI